ncbi:hypothetical protein E7T06_18115 [Deinococcus sp. Arct2-2]|uniref:hypothetical protein n=1 Tax=Deinococcus sp. Arct2-2 TaxID=2568653 RepID=UPI0010A437B0|nr:hypothetical protein [Deinococcus sp. Arct2-2]THF68102.1 hypothetical protein E7T06_18115 [Deinococcus sp. Arct2-2]
MSPLILRSKAIRQLVYLIIDGPAGYRGLLNLDTFFHDLGYQIDFIRGESRIKYSTRVLMQVQEDGQLPRLLLALVQSGSSEQLQRQVQAAINDILFPYGFTLGRDTETAAFRVAPTAVAVPPPTPEELSVPSFQNLPLSEEEVALLEDRWNEAVALHHAGALRMTLLALSLILEHVLASVHQFPKQARSSRQTPHHSLPFMDWKLDALLDVAADKGWISLKTDDLPDRVRDYREYLSLAKELREAPLLNADMVNHTKLK